VFANQRFRADRSINISAQSHLQFLDSTSTGSTKDEVDHQDACTDYKLEDVVMRIRSKGLARFLRGDVDGFNMAGSGRCPQT
jgi:hypothetical protein